MRRRRTPVESEPKAAAAPGVDKSAEIAEPALALPGVFDILEQVPLDRAMQVLQSEQPQTIALVLSELSPRRAGEILSALAGSVQAQVSRCIVERQPVDANVVHEIQKEFHDRLSVLAESSPQPEPTQPAEVEEMDFDDILDFSPETLRQAIGHMSVEDISTALVGASVEGRQKILEALPIEMARKIRQTMRNVGPLKVSDIESSQRKLLQQVRKARPGTYVSAESAAPIAVAGRKEDRA
jgi:flagellar motor switch protein FliG